MAVAGRLRAFAIFRGYMEFDLKITVELPTPLADEIAEELKKVVFLTARNIEKRAKDLVPVDTGATKNSISVEPTVPSLTHIIGPTTEYAPFIEYGTHRWEGKQFMTPAMEAETQPFRDSVAQTIAKY